MLLAKVAIGLIAAGGIILAQGRRGAVQQATPPSGKTASEDPGPGNPGSGKSLFEGKGACLSCHRVSGIGSQAAPDLSGVASHLTRDALQKALLNPNPDVQTQNRPYQVVPRAGAAITGKLLNQDAYTLQLLDSAERLRSFRKADLRDFGFLPASPMPSYGDTLSSTEVSDLIAYMASLKGSGLGPQVSFDRILNANKEPQNWLTYGGTLQSQRYSLLTQVTTANAKDLELKWSFPVRSLDAFETTPLVVDGVLYTMQMDDVIALDATTGRMFWIYRHPIPADAKHCCGNINRGLAILGNSLFLATEDAHLIALDAGSGTPIWDTIVAKATAGYSMNVAPLVIKDKVVVGVAGGEYGIRGFIAAYDAHTGKEAWHFNTIAGPGEAGRETWGGDSWMHGGGSIWVTGTYDAETNLTVWGVGNAGPDYNGDVRPGDNLYTSSMVALDGDTGKLKWYYQANPHNEFDWDAVQIPLMANITWQGQPRKTVLWGNRNGFFYVLDRTNGQFLLGKPFVKQNWNVGFDEKGRPMMAPNAKSSTEGTLIFPDNEGGTNWFNPSFSPRTGLFYLEAREGYSNLFVKGEQDFEEGTTYTGHTAGVGARRRRLEVGLDDDRLIAVRALDPQTGERKWEYKLTVGNSLNQCSGLSCQGASGILTTASDVLFAGNRDGIFVALDARDGKELWKAQLGGQINMTPITYAVDGKQYVAVNSGNSLFVFGVR